MKTIAFYFLLISFLGGTLVLVDSCKKEVNELEIPIDTMDYETITDSRDGQVYKIVKIGSQTWFAENLNYKHPDSWCYNNDENYCDMYGRLYSWETLMNGESSSDKVPSGVQGLCPKGWHIPSDMEWKILEVQIGMSEQAADSAWNRGTDEGHKLKSNGGWLYNGNGSDNVGFKALPSGIRFNYNTPKYTEIGIKTYFWSCTREDNYPCLLTSCYWRRTLSSSHSKIYRLNFEDLYSVSVRCVKD